jgi:hypothetical protein
VESNPIPNECQNRIAVLCGIDQASKRRCKLTAPHKDKMNIKSLHENDNGNGQVKATTRRAGGRLRTLLRRENARKTAAASVLMP